MVFYGSDTWILKKFFACKRIWSCPNKPDNITLYFIYNIIFDYTNIYIETVHRFLNLADIYSRKYCYCTLWQRKSKQSHYGRRTVTYRCVVLWNLARNYYININLAFACIFFIVKEFLTLPFYFLPFYIFCVALQYHPLYRYTLYSHRSNYSLSLLSLYAHYNFEHSSTCYNAFQVMIRTAVVSPCSISRDTNTIVLLSASKLRLQMQNISSQKQSLSEQSVTVVRVSCL